MNILIIGCGKLGSRLAENLYRRGHNISIIDQKEESFVQLSDDFEGLTICGMPMDVEDLKKAAIEECEAVAVVTDDDNINITVSQMVKELFNIKNVITRIVDTAKEKIFKTFGLKTICDTRLSTDAICSSLLENDSEKQLTFGSSTVGFITRDVELIMIGRNIDNIPVRKGETIIGIIDKFGKIILNNSNQEIVINSSTKIIYARIVE